MRRLFGSLSVLGLVLMPRAAAAQLLFEDQGTAVLPQGCNGSGCWTNYARAVDVDGDGDLDLVAVNCGGFFSNPQPQPLLVWRNDGAGNFVDASDIFGSISATLRQVAFGDVDGDGDVDMVAPSAGNVQPDRLFIQTAPGVYANEASTRLPANSSSDAGAVRLGDLDGDGDLDLVVAEGYLNDGADPASIYLNDGTGKFALTNTTVPTSKNGVNPDDVDLADIDGDFDLDILINFHQGQNSLWRNDGAGNFEDISASLPGLSGGAFHYGPAFCDVDNDGDLDLFTDNAATDGSYQEQLAINDGSGNFSDETSRISGNSSSDDNLIACVDYDSDGDFDFIVGSLATNHRVFQNDGQGNFQFVANAVDGPTVPNLWLEFGDLNGDKRADLFAAQGEGNPQTERLYFGTESVVEDNLAPRVIAIENVALSAASETVVRFRLSDNATSDGGPRVDRAWVLVGNQQIDAAFVGGDLFRAVVPATSESVLTVCSADASGVTECDGGEGGGGAGGSGAGGDGGSATGGASQGPGPSGSGAGGTGGGGTDSDSEGGCDCSLPAQSSTPGLALGALGLLWAAARRRAGRGGK